MKIKVSITHQPKGQGWPSLMTQTFESWQKAFKESQRMVNKFVLAKNSRLLKVLIEEEV